MPVPILKLCPPAEALAADADLLARFVSSRDEAAFAELVRRHGPVVYRVCHRLTPTSADDAFQAVFLILACSPQRVRIPAAVGSWLVGVAGRVARQVRATERRRTDHERRVARLESAPFGEPGDLAAVLDEEITRLPEELRAPVVLCLIGGRTHAQAADALGGSARTIRRRLEQARALLRARLKRRGIVPAVAAALLAGLDASARAVPPALARQTVTTVFQFLDGGAPLTAATAVAKGVMDDMFRFKASVLMATAAAALVCLGVAWSQDRPAPSAPPAPVGSNHSVDLPLAGAPGVPAGPERIPARDVNQTESKAANFVVHAPTPMMARVIAAEAEYHRRAIALKWLGRELLP
jgi:RNA polymerase sigma factor (sigma-70 family)